MKDDTEITMIGGTVAITTMAADGATGGDHERWGGTLHDPTQETVSGDAQG